MSETLIYQPSETTHWKNLFPSKMMLLGSQNLNEGEELDAKIKHVEVQIIKDKNGNEEHVPVVSFYNSPPMVLNITNSKTIAALYGDHYIDWKSKSIQIYTTKVLSFGEYVTALRVRATIPSCDEDISSHLASLESCRNLPELQKVFTKIPKHLKPRLIACKDAMKKQIGSADVQG